MATTYDKASLVMLPSGYKDDKLYSIKPTDGSGDFTFSRDGAGASPATRVNASGLIEKGRENVILQSNTFDTTWANASTTETGGQSGYDGSSDAWLLDKSAANGRILQTISFSGVQTFSVYAKAGSLNFMLLMATTSGGDRTAYFNFSTGAVGSGTNVDANIVSIGGGWYRCSVTFSESTNGLRIYPADGDNDTSGTSGNIYIQDAQLESGLIATSVIETTTSAVSAGLLGDMPRLDYSGGATCPSLLLEPSRTNAFNHSEYSAGIEYNNVNSVTNNAGISPEGVQNALEIDAAANDIADSYRNVGSGVVATFSVFAKAGTGDSLGLNPSSTGSNAIANFDLTNGTITSTGYGQYIDSSIEDYGNGWYRCSITFTTGTGSYINRMRFYDTGTYQLYGFQLEAGSYPTSYIPTYGSASGRALDEADCLDTGITSNVGTWYIEFGELNSGGYGSSLYSILINPSSGNQYISFLSNQTQNTLRVRVNDGTTTQYVGASFNIGEVNKYVIKWDGTTLTFFRNGFSYGSVSFTSTQAFSVMNLPNPARAALYPTKQTLCFPTALTDAECIALTTL